MSNPTYYNQVEAVQRTVSQLMREDYMPSIPELLFKTGSPTLRMMKPSEKVAQSDTGGLIQRVITGRANSGRATRTLLKDFSKGRTARSAKVKLRLDYDDPSANDFVSVEATTALPWHDFVTSGPDASQSILEEAQSDVFDSLDYTTSVLMHTDKTGAIGAINGSPKNDYGSEGTYADATTYTGGSTTASILVDGHTIGIFRENVHLDFYSSAGVLLADEVRIDKVTFEEESLSLALTDDSTVANLDALTDNAVIYLAGTKDSGFKCSFGEMFKTNYANDSWVGGLDRSASGNRHWIPVRTRLSATVNAPMQKSYLDDAFQAIGFRTANREGQGHVVIAGTKVIDNFRSDVGESAIVEDDPNSRGSYTIGEMGLAYQHPVAGKISLVGDYTARNDIAYGVIPSDMSMYYANMVGPVIMSDGTAGKGFERVEGSDANSGGSKFYKLEVMEQKAPFFDKIVNSFAIMKVS